MTHKGTTEDKMDQLIEASKLSVDLMKMQIATLQRQMDEKKNTKETKKEIPDPS